MGDANVELQPATTARVADVDYKEESMRQITINLLLTFVSAGQFPSSAANLSLGSAESLPIQDDLAGKPLPLWRDGVLVVLDHSDGSRVGINVYGRNGQRASTLSFGAPGAKHISVRGFNRGTDGAIALCGSMTDQDGRSGAYVAWISADGATTQVIRTSPFVAWRVAFAADGTIWAQGTELRPRGSGEAPRKTFTEAIQADAAIFRQFSRSGKMLRAVVPQSEIRVPDALNSATSLFEAVGDRIVWYSEVSRDYIAIAPDGSVVRVDDLALPSSEKLTGSAINREGEMFVSSVSSSTWSVSRLDLEGRTWTRVSSGSIDDRDNHNRRLTLFGAEGDSLVAIGNDSQHIRFVRVNR
jgi:hypothetical protein